jgi:hypothetical protein
MIWKRRHVLSQSVDVGLTERVETSRNFRNNVKRIKGEIGDKRS